MDGNLQAQLVQGNGVNLFWAAERPLSMDQLHYLVKLYAGWAGLKAETITCHTLRHSAVMCWVEAASYKRIQRFLQTIDPCETLRLLFNEEADFVIGDPTEIERLHAHKTEYVARCGMGEAKDFGC